MAELIQLGDIAISVTRKDVKNVHLSVHPPDGRVTLVAPTSTRLDVARAYAITRIGWIRQQRDRFAKQAREAPRQYRGRETHYLWGRRHLLKLAERDEKPTIKIDHRTIHLQVRPGTTRDQRACIIHEWHLGLLHEAVPELIRKWEGRIGVKVQGYFLQRMKTKWGSCNPQRGTIRLNTELVKKPRDMLEYVIVHEIVHLIEAKHTSAFFEHLDRLYPNWSVVRSELNELPLSAESWPVAR
ncbi:SprT family zinc-dependent metalloprotease [Hansschlegelia sp.]|uniref:M48 family metallopeptidase n=1 Tax=Hansschlegelia sp. TaxID=2041892 RepID=UPI002C54AF58|nr:SprT family zinc-dependent metalloprotease [Hansschlegelia sp.]HVI30183.1 SprT family zinc-dependent metalloprotease [Hansschlegelia sp.]